MAEALIVGTGSNRGGVLAEAAAQGRQAVAAGGGPASFPSGGKNDKPGAPPSNTAPATCTDQVETTLLRAGIDSLYLSYPGELSLESTIRLDQLKSLAQSGSADYRALAQLEIAGHCFEVRDRGRHPFRFILEDGWYRLEIGGAADSRVPLVHARLASHALTLIGPEALNKDLSQVASGLGTLSGKANPSLTVAA